MEQAEGKLTWERERRRIRGEKGEDQKKGRENEGRIDKEGKTMEKKQKQIRKKKKDEAEKREEQSTEYYANERGKVEEKTNEMSKESREK